MLKGQHKYNFNRDVFENIDTKEKAYWHGFISADGYVNRKTFCLHLGVSDKDEILIDRVIKFLKAPLYIKRHYVKSKDKYHCKNREYRYCIMSVYSEKLVSDFLKHTDITCNKKAKRLTLPDFGDERLNLAWLMGYYDGDGSEKCPRLSSSSRKLLEQIKEKYDIDFKIDRHKNVYILYLGEHFREKLCENYENSLLRKRIAIDGREKRFRNKNLIKLTHEILSSLVETHSMSEIGKMFGFSRLSVFAKCKRLKIQVPKRRGGRNLKVRCSNIKNNCKYFPCHNMNNFTWCDFCYCPLYSYDCKGNYTILENGVKDCSKCELPHKEDGYDFVVGFLKKQKLKNV